MATSGTTAFSLSIADCLDEAFERVKVEPATLTAGHLISARRSLDLLFIEWQNEMPMQWKIEEEVIALTADQASYTLDSDIIDIVCMIYRDNGQDSPVFPMSRDQYDGIVEKTMPSTQIDRYFFDRQKAAPVIKVFPVPSSVTNRSLRAYVLREIEDSGALRNDPDVAKHFLPALCAGWAWKLAEKYAPQMMDAKEKLAMQALQKALERDQEQADVVFTLGDR